MKLENDRLHIFFAETGEIRTQRFDNTAIVKQVVLDGRYAFCVPEQIHPGRRTTNGTGLCGEFVLQGAAESAKAGEWFYKPGVGLLRQTVDNRPYDIWTDYDMRPFTVTVQKRDAGVICRQQAIPCGGFGMEIEKRFLLKGNRLILDIYVRNVGTKAFCLQEYQHNFVSLGGMPVSEGYVLELGCDKALARIEAETLRQGDEISLPSAVRVQGERVFWKKAMDGSVLYHRSENVDEARSACWTLRHLPSGLSVCEETGFCPSRIDVWAVEHCICAELYHTVQLVPGEMAHWQRIWTFDFRGE